MPLLLAALFAAPTTADEIHVEGLRAPAEVLEDSEGIPHAFVRSERDAYFLMGYLHSRDRFFQMDFFRHVFDGTLTEFVGGGALGSDTNFRSFDLRATAEESFHTYSRSAQRLLRDYARGVNAARVVHPLPLEYSLLELSEASVDPWEPWDGILLLKGFSTGAWLDLSDLDLTLALGAFEEAGRRQGFDGDRLFFEDIFRLAPIDPVATVPSRYRGRAWEEDGSEDGETAEPATLPTSREPSGTAMDHVSPGHMDLIREVKSRLSENSWLKESLNGSSRGQGSNWWLLSGRNTTSRSALLANDPHQFLSMPPLIYPLHLLVGPRGRINNLSGSTFAGIPAVVSGCNKKICWGATNNALDMTDTFAEEVLVDAGGRPTHTVFRGRAEAVRVLEHSYRANTLGDGVVDNLQVMPVASNAGGESYQVPRRNGGPLLSFGPAVDGVAPGLSVQWTGWSANRDLEAYVELHRATNPTTFVRALRFADGFSFNMSYADVRGRIGYFVTGELPLREDLQLLEAVDGAPPFLIRDGSGQSRHEWLRARRWNSSRSLSFEILPRWEMPRVFDPRGGILVSSNNDPLGGTADNDPFNERRRRGGVLYLNRSFVSLRASWVAAELENLTAGRGRVSEAEVRALQADNRQPDAALLNPYLVAAFDRAEASGAPGLLAAQAANPVVAEAISFLRNWDLSTPTGILEGYDPGDDAAALGEPDPSEVRSSVAATLFNVWRGQAIRRIVDAPLEAQGLGGALPNGRQAHVALIHLVTTVASNGGMGASGLSFFDVPGLGVEEARDFLLLAALEDTLELLRGPAFDTAFGGSANLEDYRWGKLHRITIPNNLGGPFNLPPAGGFSDLAPGLPGLARSGGFETVDVGPYDPRAANDQAFTFGLAAGARTYFSMERSGPESYEILPGGATGDPLDPGYAGQMDRWLTNRYERFLLKPWEVRSDAVAREVLIPR